MWTSAEDEGDPMAVRTKGELDPLDHDGALEQDESGPLPSSHVKARRRDKDSQAPSKRRCVSTACIACRRRKSKCDGNTPSCAACASVYGTECVYDPASDNRRKGVYKKTIDSLRTRNSTLQTLIQAILNSSEDDVLGLVREIRSCESLDDVAESILANDGGLGVHDHDAVSPANGAGSPEGPTFETELSGKMGELRLDEGSVRFIGGTSNLIFLGPCIDGADMSTPLGDPEQSEAHHQPVASWTTVTSDQSIIVHLLNMYFTWHYPYFTTLSKSLFLRDFALGKPTDERASSRSYCSSLLVNAILALGCHFTSIPEARLDPTNPATAGDHFFKEAKRLILENDEHEKPKLTTVQALALMSVREAGCGREAKGWVYSGMSFRMAFDVGLNLDSGALTANMDLSLDEQAIDARRITFWGCFLFDKCWSNYLGRQPQLPSSIITVPKIDVFPSEDAATWYPYTDAGRSQAHSQPARTRAVALQISNLCEISSDLLIFFYDPAHADKHVSKSTELKKLSELHRRLEAWRKALPRELEAREGALPSVLLMHMFFQLLFIHLFRPFLKYNQATSPLPAHVSPRKQCTQAATTISKLLRLYKRTYGLRQICNIAVYIAHSACTIHLLNLPEKTATRDIAYGVRHLEEIAEGWPCATRTLSILGVLAQRWKISLPDEAAAVLARTDLAYQPLSRENSSSPTIRAGASRETPSDFATPVSRSVPQPSPSTARPSCSPPPPPPPPPPPSSCPTSPNHGSHLHHGLVSHPVMPLPSGPADFESPFLAQASYSAEDGLVMGSSAPHLRPAAPPPLSGSGILGSTNGLVHESQDWWYRDQSVFHVGFGNWHGTNSNSPAAVDPGGGGGGGGGPAPFPAVNAPVNSHPGSLDGLVDGEWYV